MGDAAGQACQLHPRRRRGPQAGRPRDGPEDQYGRQPGRGAGAADLEAPVESPGPGPRARRP
eukprot:7469417-Pyramimonas_sp.AAC.1